MGNRKTCRRAETVGCKMTRDFAVDGNYQTKLHNWGNIMSFRRGMIWTRVALAIVFTIGGAFTAVAQGPRGPVPEPYTPAADAKDLKSVLFKWMWGTGMLKGHDERDMVASLEYQGKGTIQVEGQPCTLTKYRASTNYQTFSQRIQYACTRPNGETYSNIEVVSGLYAWNEDTPGAQIGGTKGKATPMPATVAGAAHPNLGKSPGRTQGRGGRDHGDILAGSQPRHSFRGRSREGGPNVRVVGERQAGGDVPDSGRSGGDRDSHAGCELYDRARGGQARARRPPSSPTATIRTGTTR